MRSKNAFVSIPTVFFGVASVKVCSKNAFVNIPIDFLWSCFPYFVFSEMHL